MSKITDQLIEFAGDEEGGTVTIKINSVDDEGFNYKNHHKIETELDPASVLLLEIESENVNLVPNDFTKDYDLRGDKHELANRPIHRVLRNILNEADEPITFEELEDKFLNKLQEGIRGLIFSGELEREDKTEEITERVYSLTDNNQ